MPAGLTSTQVATLKTFILADPTLGPKATAGDYDFIANALNAPAAGPFVVWQNNVSTDVIFGCVSLAAYTPTDNPPASPSTDLTYSNRAFQCQLKQANIMMLLTGRASLQTSRQNVRQALNDALQNVPSGASGALVDAGWLGANGVRLTIQRNASLAEKQLATGTGTQANPATLGWEGTIGAGDIGAILA